MKQLQLLIISTLCCLCLIGCDVRKWPGFGEATPRPDARILIELPKELSITELYPRYVEAASQGGFAHFYGYTGAPSMEYLLSDSYNGYLSGVSWTEQPNQNTSFVRRIRFGMKYNNRNEPDVTKKVSSSVTFILYRDNTDKFTKEEWKLFFRFYREILPSVFQDEGVQISISRHPAKFTDKDLLLEIQANTDFEIPEKYLAAQ